MPSFLCRFYGRNKIPVNYMSPNESRWNCKSKRAILLNFQSLEESPSFVAAPKSSRGLLGMRTFITDAARNCLSREHCRECRPRNPAALLCNLACPLWACFPRVYQTGLMWPSSSDILSLDNHFLRKEGRPVAPRVALVPCSSADTYLSWEASVLALQLLAGWVWGVSCEWNLERSKFFIKFSREGAMWDDCIQSQLQDP